MPIDVDKYPLTVRPLAEDEGGGYLCEFPDVPGCMGDGETPADAIADGREALQACFEAFRELDQTVPAPATASGQWRMRAPRSLHQRLADRAKVEGVSLNTFAVSLLAEGLGVREQKTRNNNSTEQRRPSRQPS